MSLIQYLRKIAWKLRRRFFPQSLKNELILLRDSGYFDSSWYQQNNPDVIAHGMDPLLHYLLYGGLEGRTPGPKFDSLGYLESNPDVCFSGVNPLVHYLQYGRVEGRSPYGTKHENDIIADMRAIQEYYIQAFGRPVNFRHPTSETEKVQILKLAYRNPIFSKFADKAIAKEIVGETIGKQYIVPLIAVYDRFENIPREKLPNQFVLKANHGSGFNIICRNKDSFDWENAAKETQYWLEYDFSMRFREWCYRDIKRKLIVEQLIDENGSLPFEVDFYVYAGKVKEISFVFDRGLDTASALHLTPDWRQLPYNATLPTYPHNFDRPPQIDLMIKLAEKLGQGFPYVRVDFYLCGGQVFFSEMTFYPGAGFSRFTPPEWDQLFGERLDLNGIYDAEYFGNLSDKVLLDIASEAAGRPISSTAT